MKYIAYAANVPPGTDLPSYFRGVVVAPHLWPALKWGAQEWKTRFDTAGDEVTEYHEVAVYFRAPGDNTIGVEPDYYTFAEIEEMIR